MIGVLSSTRFKGMGAASSYRATDMRGGANGGRIRLDPQNSWAVNKPAELNRVLAVLEQVQQDFNAKAKGGKQISIADLVVLGGTDAVEQAAAAAGHKISLSFTPGRVNTSQDMTNAASFRILSRWLTVSATIIRKAPTSRRLQP